MKYKLVIFDFDGTLADSFPYFLRTINTLAAQYKFQPLDLKNVDRLRGMHARELMKAGRIPAWKIPFIARSFVRLMARDIEQIQLFDGVADLLRRLAAQGVQLAIVSSNSGENVRQVLGPEVASLIAQYGCGSALFGKPRKFRKVMARCGVTPAETLCVGDEIRDIEAARDAQIPFGSVAWGYARPDILKAQSGGLFFETVSDIAPAVLGIKPAAVS